MSIRENINPIQMLCKYDCKIVFQGMIYLTTMGKNSQQKTKTMTPMLKTVQFCFNPDGGLQTFLRVILTEETRNLPSSHGLVSYGTR